MIDVPGPKATPEYTASAPRPAVIALFISAPAINDLSSELSTLQLVHPTHIHPDAFNFIDTRLGSRH
jgi:hypothetical protein